MTWGDGSAGPINFEACFGTLTIGDVSLACAAWAIPDLSALWSTPPVRGQNRLIPGVVGRKPYKRRLDENKVSLPFLVTGYCDSEGMPYADVGMTPDQGLEANIAFLQNRVVLPTAGNATDTTQEATMVLPSGNVRRSLVQVLELSGQLKAGAVFKGVLTLIDVEAQLIVGGDNFISA